MTQAINVGDTIKSYDFPGNKNCFMTGKVYKIDDEYLYCKTISRVFSGKEVDFDPDYRTPQQGFVSFDTESDPRIVKL